MPQYMMALRADLSAIARYSPEEMQKLFQRYRDWRESVQAQGNKLKNGEGRVLRKSAGKYVVTDGPFTESKEVLGGFFMLTAVSYDAVVDLAYNCPHLEFGSIEIREVE